jgi:hypothetical protein
MLIRTDATSNLLHALVTSAILSSVPLLDFYATNMAELTNPSRVLHYAAGTLAAAAILATTLVLLLRRIPVWRILLATGLMVFVFFAYDVGLIHRELKAHLGDWAPAAWIAVTIGIGALALAFIRQPAAISIALAASIAFSAPSLARIATMMARAHSVQALAAKGVAAATRFAI